MSHAENCPVEKERRTMCETLVQHCDICGIPLEVGTDFEVKDGYYACLECQHDMSADIEQELVLSRMEEPC